MPENLVLDTQKPWELIKQCPAYQPTPFREVFTSAGFRALIKDETSRLNLGAFKALGGIYAVAAFLLDRWQKENHGKLDPNLLFEKHIQDWSNRFTFVCASAGNHGMAVAKGAQLFNAQSRIHLADTVPPSFEERLTALGATVMRSGATYEDSMLAAANECESENSEAGNFVLLADSSWAGYTELPRLIMEGYTVMAEEMRLSCLSFKDHGDWPTHMFLQAGVGGLAAAIAYHVRQHWDVQPQIIVVEPDAAPCLFESNRLGKLTMVDGPVSSMGRLDCKEPSMLAFESLQQTADKFVCITEADAADAVSFLGKKGIATTPSGAAGVAAMLNAERLGIPLGNDGTSLAIATECPI